MTVFNKTNKIIGIDGTPVLPLAFAEVPDSFKDNSILQRMADEGRIVINPSESAARAAPEAPPADTPPVMTPPPEPEEAPPAAEAPASEAQEPVVADAAAPKAEDAPPAESPFKKKAAKA